ncbi:MAG: GGDEF domain-containing protein [Deltaproteobacteria bacterium]|nr:GGDEF domain-containing protein [Candidatus Anaeroferrophillacea bacterium]
MDGESGACLASTIPWRELLAPVDYAFQPIVNIHTGVCHGYEGLLRNVEQAGFPSINAVFDQAYEDHSLVPVCTILREKVLEKYVTIPWARETKLFYNIDNRTFEENGNPGPQTEGAQSMLKRFGLTNGVLCIEISERHPLPDMEAAMFRMNRWRKSGFQIAVDDCGTGFSGLQLLYYLKPDYVKIDRFFIRDIERDQTKRLFVASIVNIAHLMGATVIAEGVETEKEYYSCRNIGCDLVQGYLIQYPSRDIGDLRRCYDEMTRLGAADRRYRDSKDHELIQQEIEYIEPISAATPLLRVLDIFRQSTSQTFFPVVNERREPQGIIRESAIKDLAYSRYGRYLLENRTISMSLDGFIGRLPTVDVYSSAEKLVDLYAMNSKIEGVLVVDGMEYIGFLSAQSLLKILNAKNLALARDQNPLSGLPGNKLIYEYVSRALLDRDVSYALVYFDFDNFKAYNDTYGFRHGDRVILLFTELLKSRSQDAERFAGHIGGDDFFMGIRDLAAARVRDEVVEIIEIFRRDVESFYDPDAIRRGFILAKDREGGMRRFPLITVSAAVLILPPGMNRIYSPEEIGNLIAGAKQEAKRSPDKMCIRSLKHFTGKESPGEFGACCA